MKNNIYIKRGSYVTWNNATNSTEVHRCLFIKLSDYTCTMKDIYRISINAFGKKLNRITCGDYNRHERYCR